MELCYLNLERFIYSNNNPQFESQYPYFETLFDSTNKTSAQVRTEHMWSIMLDIVQGLHYIHSHEQVHRDLKPRNSKSRTELN
jgi:serine/threonine protein kinase